ncbi:MAG: AAA family ATPase, partial [Propionibacteriaceae bacterium]|nr:AAA family ATPase [Propionibacteriaceae bacterium]
MSGSDDPAGGALAPQVGQAVLTRELAAEQAIVDKAYSCLRIAAASARQIDDDAHRRYQTDRADWHREEASTALFERDAFAFQAAKRLAILDAEHEGLVFGRLDLADAEVRHIGRLGVRDDDFEPLVIDWRAPAAEPFYRATFTDPMGVTRRRVLHCHGEQVIGIEDDLLDDKQADGLAVLGEGALLAALTRARTTTMRDIVATIQAEQDEAIRAPYQGVTIISGGPGTGKTVVALHRAAYLLYTHRRRLTNGGVLIVGPSMIFMRYIERVLPGLGEDSVTLKALGQVASDVLDVETSRYDDAEPAALKGSLRMARLLRRLVADPLAEASEAQRLTVSVKGEILTLQSPTLTAIRRRVLSTQKANRARASVRTAMLDALWSAAPIDVTDDVDRLTFDELITSQARWQMFMQAWWPTLDPEQVLGRLAEPRVVARVAAGILTPAEQSVLAASLSYAKGYAPGLGLPRPRWTIADTALLDELVALIGPPPPPEP